MLSVWLRTRPNNHNKTKPEIFVSPNSERECVWVTKSVICDKYMNPNAALNKYAWRICWSSQCFPHHIKECFVPSDLSVISDEVYSMSCWMSLWAGMWTSMYFHLCWGHHWANSVTLFQMDLQGAGRHGSKQDGEWTSWYMKYLGHVVKRVMW